MDDGISAYQIAEGLRDTNSILIDMLRQAEQANEIADAANELAQQQVEATKVTNTRLTSLFDIIALSNFAQLAKLNEAQMDNYVRLAKGYTPG